MKNKLAISLLCMIPLMIISMIYLEIRSYQTENSSIEEKFKHHPMENFLSIGLTESELNKIPLSSLMTLKDQGIKKISRQSQVFEEGDLTLELIVISLEGNSQDVYWQGYEEIYLFGYFQWEQQLQILSRRDQLRLTWQDLYNPIQQGSMEGKTSAKIMIEKGNTVLTQSYHRPDAWGGRSGQSYFINVPGLLLTGGRKVQRSGYIETFVYADSKVSRNPILFEYGKNPRFSLKKGDVYQTLVYLN